MTKPRILIVDDDYVLVRALQAALMDEGYDVMAAPDGEKGLRAAQRYRPDVIILDINMPFMDGLELCRRLRAGSNYRDTAILFLTSHNGVDDQVEGLNEGADDYLGKPFNAKVLRARVRALLRRTGALAADQEADEQVLRLGPIALDLQAYRVQPGRGQRVQLTPAEFDLLRYLMAHPGQPFSSDQLLENVWSYAPGTADPSLVRWHIKNLRQKIEPDPAEPVYLRTVSRYGYMMEAPATGTVGRPARAGQARDLTNRATVLGVGS